MRAARLKFNWHLYSTCYVLSSFISPTAQFVYVCFLLFLLQYPYLVAREYKSVFCLAQKKNECYGGEIHVPLIIPTEFSRMLNNSLDGGIELAELLVIE